MVQIIKRNKSKESFDRNKIISAMSKAYIEVDGQLFEDDTVNEIADEIYEDIKNKKEIEVEEIQDRVEEALMDTTRKDVARAYVRYRYKRELLRKSNTTDKSIKELLDGENEYWKTENSNKNPKRTPVQRDYLAGITSTDITRRFLLTPDIIEAHDAGIIHFHDADYFAQNALHNCELINLEDMLQNGTMINDVLIESPHRLLTAMTIATQIIQAVTSCSYGGASISLTHLAPFVRKSKEAIAKEITEELKNIDIKEKNELIQEITLKRLKKEINAAVQTFNYQTNSMTNTNGQAPFLSVFMYLNETEEYKVELAMLIEEFLNQRMLGFKNEKGVYITPAFPKLIYVLEEDNIKPNSKYWYLTELAAKCTAKRMVPDYISEKVMKQLKVDENGQGQCFPVMGCRSALTPAIIDGKPKYYGRFNQGVVTINLADVAFSSGKDLKKFWDIFEERLELCHKALQLRHERLSHAISDVSPILWRDGALARLPKGESIHSLLHNNYSTISLGYAALYECVKYMIGESHTSPKGKEFGIKVMQKLNDKCNEWKEVENISYSVYGSPIESTTYKFAKCLKERFGQNIFIKLDGKDRNYISNSYHVPVFEKISAFDKIEKEAVFQALSPGGAVSYVEVPNMQNNIPAVLQILHFIYDHIMYAELNCKSDYCQNCGFDGEMQIDENMEWYCPSCGNRDQETLNVARRTCGYIGSQFWNYGRTEEIKDRVLHVQ